VVLKMPRNPPHDNTILKLGKRLARLVPDGWEIRNQSAVTLPQSEPEPDLTVVRGDENTYASRHPAAPEVGLLVEVADSTLQRDQTDKLRIYAAAGIVCYWIVNLVDRRIEVYSSPASTSATSGYARRDDFGRGDSVPVVLDQLRLGEIAVSEVID
jgi:Uma2 family endonuclease